jgi:hypothetical protein
MLLPEHYLTEQEKIDQEYGYNLISWVMDDIEKSTYQPFCIAGHYIRAAKNPKNRYQAHADSRPSMWDIDEWLKELLETKSIQSTYDHKQDVYYFFKIQKQ